MYTYILNINKNRNAYIFWTFSVIDRCNGYQSNLELVVSIPYNVYTTDLFANDNLITNFNKYFYVEMTTLN